MNDPGHNHVNIVKDPGHQHTTTAAKGNSAGGQYQGFWQTNPDPGHPAIYQANNATTGIVVDSQLAKSSVEVSIDANDAGEHYPLVYVLLCQKLP